MMTGTDFLLFVCPGYEAVAASLLAYPRFEQGSVEMTTFPDGEVSLRIVDSVLGRRVVVVGGTHDNNALCHLLDLCDGLTSAGAISLRICLSYFGYARQDHESAPGHIVAAKTRARRFSSLLPAPHGIRVAILDPHEQELAHFFERPILAHTLRSTSFWPGLLASQTKEVWQLNDFQLASTDLGRPKSLQRIAAHLGVEVVFVGKDRLDGSHTQVTGTSGELSSHSVILFDDMISTGGSAIGAARTLREMGAKDLYLVASHGVFTHGAAKRLYDTGVFASVLTTDSHPRALEAVDELRESGVTEFLSVLPCGELYARWIEASA